MVNTAQSSRSTTLAPVAKLVGVYVSIVVATIVALVILSAVASSQATPEAWVHAVIVAVFAVLLPLRFRAARRGSAHALKAVGVIAIVLVAVNVVEAVIPGLFPLWMRFEMIAIAILMALIALLVLRRRA